MNTPNERLVQQLKEIREQIQYYGLVLGACFILIELFQYWMKDNLSMSGIMLLMLLKISTVFGATYYIVKNIKKNYFKKGITYAQCFSLILRLFLYGSLLAGIFSFVLNRWICPDYFNILLENTVTLLQSYWDTNVVTAEQTEYFNEIIEPMKEAQSPSALQSMWNQIWSYTTLGAFVGIILSFFLRDKNVPPFNI